MKKMARTTSYTCTLVAGVFKIKGVNTPETVIEFAGNLAYILKYRQERGVKYKINQEITPLLDFCGLAYRVYEDDKNRLKLIVLFFLLTTFILKSIIKNS